MAMEVLELAGYKISFDRDVTLASYAAFQERGPVGCTCRNCMNWLLLPEDKFPKEFCDLLAVLGVDPHKESEVCEVYESGEKLHVYDGWFTFAGEVIEKGEQHIQVAESDFQYFFEKERLFGPVFPSAFDGRVSRISFMGTFPWLL